MKFYNNIKIRNKLIGAFLILMILTGITGAIGIFGLGLVSSSSEAMYKNNLVEIYDLTDMKENLSDARADLLQLVFERNDSEKEQIKADIESIVKENNQYISEIDKMAMTPSEKQIYSTYKNLLSQFRSTSEELITCVDNKDINGSIEKYHNQEETRNEIFTQINKLIDMNNTAAKKQNDLDHSVYISERNIVAAIMIISMLISIGFTILLTLTIALPIKKAVKNLKTVAKGDFTTVIPEKYMSRKDEVGELVQSINYMQNNTKDIIKTINTNSQDMSALSEELSAAVEEVTAKSEDINESSQNIASGLEETSASTEEITASIEEVDANINELSKKALVGSNISNKFKESAMAAQESSQTSREQSRSIYEEKEKKIIKAIEDGKVVGEIKEMADTIAEIAAQTNLLALNAAIEAARAGEQGKGFAVVAEEVRTLAEQSGQAVTVIQDTIVKVQNAFSNLSNNSEEILKFINEHVEPQFKSFAEIGKQYYTDAESVSRMSDEIAAMSEELTATINQVSEAVQNLSATTQKSTEHAEAISESIGETTQGMEQVAKTAEVQAEMAQKLNEIVLRFKI